MEFCQAQFRISLVSKKTASGFYLRNYELSKTWKKRQWHHGAGIISPLGGNVTAIEVSLDIELLGL